jgi:hypothetical protein
VHFDFDDLIIVGSNKSLPPIEPQGLSGCAIFHLQRVRKTGIWHTGQMNVIGIQSTFLPNRKLLRATRSEHAAQLIERVRETHGRST